MGSKNAPSGFGVWIAFQQAIGSVDESIRRLKAVGAQWVAPRGGEGAYRDGSWTPEKARAAIQKYHAAGIKVYPWLYSRPNSYLVEIQTFKAFMDEGADGVFIDAEIEWQGPGGSQKAAAEHYMQGLRDALGDDCFIGHAPFPYVMWHLDFPYVEFGTYCDAVADQLYWTEINDQGAKANIAKTAAQWSIFLKQHPEAAKVRCPIGNTYGKELKGVKNPPPGTFRAQDMKDFVEWCKAQELPFYSVYSLDAACPDAMQAMQEIAGVAQPVAYDPPADDSARDDYFAKNWGQYREILASAGVEIPVPPPPDPTPSEAITVPQGSQPWFVVVIQMILALFAALFGRRR